MTRRLGKLVLDVLLDVRADRVADRLRASAAQPSRPLLSKHDLAIQLGVSVAPIDRPCREGRLPFVLVGESKRFDLHDVRAGLPRPGPGPTKVREPSEGSQVRYGRRRPKR